MKFRKLRIAWSVACGIACVLLIALWVRSYWCADVIDIPRSKYLVEVGSEYGKIGIVKFDDPSISAGRWEFVSEDPRPPGGDVWLWPTLLGFARPVTPGMSAIVVPHWFLVLQFASAGALPRLQGFQRFSLRTLLIATTLVAVVLGLIVWAVH